MQPLIRRGTYETLNEGDVWELSPTMLSKPVFLKFSELTYGDYMVSTLSFVHIVPCRRKSLLRQIWAANSKDLLYVYDSEMMLKAEGINLFVDWTSF